jgi:hypothetical protein
MQPFYFSKLGIPGWAMCRVLPWSASLFRDNQTAVESGNVGPREKLIGENNNKSAFSLSHLANSVRLNDSGNGNFRVKIILFLGVAGPEIGLQAAVRCHLIQVIGGWAGDAVTGNHKEPGHCAVQQNCVTVVRPKLGSRARGNKATGRRGQAEEVRRQWACVGMASGFQHADLI